MTNSLLPSEITYNLDKAILNFLANTSPIRSLVVKCWEVCHRQGNWNYILPAFIKYLSNFISL
jgi:hypothetical protein